jgi:hypothetical protein
MRGLVLAGAPSWGPSCAEGAGPAPCDSPESGQRSRGLLLVEEVVDRGGGDGAGVPACLHV